MNLTSPTQVAELLQAHGLRPRKRWGQNFLIDRNTLDNVLRAAEVVAQGYEQAKRGFPEPTTPFGLGPQYGRRKQE